MRSGAVGATALALVVAVTGCANTINEAALTAESSTTTVAFVPTGTTAELLDQLVEEAGTLSEAIVQNEGDDAIVGRLDKIWAAARPAVEQDAPNLVVEFDLAVAMLHRGVDRRRPADADKATRNLRVLVAAI